MNERIRELAEHCDFYVGNEHYNESHEEKQRLWVEKFAELSVRECIDIASQEDFDVMMKEGYPCSQTAKKIKEHFGIEK